MPNWSDMLRNTGKTWVNQKIMFEGKCNRARPYWRCLSAPHQWLNLEECMWGQRDSFHTQLLKRKGAFFVPMTGDPGTHGCSKLPCSISSVAFTGQGILQLSELLFPAVFREPPTQADKRGNARLTLPWALPWGVRNWPALPMASAAGLPPSFRGHSSHRPQLSSPGHRCDLCASKCYTLLTTASQMLTNLTNSSSSMKQTHPAQSLPNCHFGWCHVFINHQRLGSTDIKSCHGFTKMFLEKKKTSIVYWQ